MQRDLVEQWVGRLLSAEARAAVVVDGWPAAMVEAGFELHRKSWDVEAIAQDVARQKRLDVPMPASMVHIWPALPGAGVSPVLFAALAGVGLQGVRASSRLKNFSEFVCDGQVVELTRAYEDAEVVVVSGADETVQAVRDRARGRVVGYGHRVSLAIVEEEAASEEVAREIAHDVVMWHQQGCFSVRGVIFVGGPMHAKKFGEWVGDFIHEWEGKWNAVPWDFGSASRRAQARGVAELMGDVYGPGFGFVATTEGPFRGQTLSTQAITLHVVPNLQAALHIIEVPAHQRQGVALALGESDINHWGRVLLASGFTRVCAPGELQAPPATWQHDGRPNAELIYR